jgi:hypothetical protein
MRILCDTKFPLGWDRIVALESWLSHPADFGGPYGGGARIFRHFFLIGFRLLPRSFVRKRTCETGAKRARKREIDRESFTSFNFRPGESGIAEASNETISEVWFGDCRRANVERYGHAPYLSE